MAGIVKKLALANFVVMAAGVVAGAGVIGLYGKSLPPQVPLWYSRPWGEEQLASPGELWVVPALILVLGTVTGVGSRRGVLSAMLLATSLVTQTILGLALLRVVLLVL